MSKNILFIIILIFILSIIGLDINARYYDPDIGRFTSADSVTPGGGVNLQGLNRYSYCSNNPVKYVDPKGHDPVTPEQKMGTGIGMMMLGTVVVGGSGLLTYGSGGLASPVLPEAVPWGTGMFLGGAALMMEGFRDKSRVEPIAIPLTRTKENENRDTTIIYYYPTIHYGYYMTFGPGSPIVLNFDIAQCLNAYKNENMAKTNLEEIIREGVILQDLSDQVSYTITPDERIKTFNEIKVKIDTSKSGVITSPVSGKKNDLGETYLMRNYKVLRDFINERNQTLSYPYPSGGNLSGNHQGFNQKNNGNPSNNKKIIPKDDSNPRK